MFADALVNKVKIHHTCTNKKQVFGRDDMSGTLTHVRCRGIKLVT